MNQPAAPVDDETSSRHRLLLATAEVLGRSGQTKLSLSEVALQAGVSRPTLYRWFASKDELLKAFGVFEREAFNAGITKATAGLRGNEKLDAALRFIVDYQQSYSGVRIVDIEPEVSIGGAVPGHPADAVTAGEDAAGTQQRGEGGHCDPGSGVALHRPQRRRRSVPRATPARRGPQAEQP